jgi:glycosyltransferase involved in cell wall biosynthesis
MDMAESPSVAKRYKVALFNSGDPRGSKVGGIETYTRDYIFYHPEDMDLLFVGPDETGKLPIGEVSEIEFRGRTIKFLPLFHLDDSSYAAYGEGITKSDTWRFASQLVKHWGKVRKILKDGGYSAEIRRVEYAPILWSMGVPFVQMVHVWGGKDQKMSSSLGKHWYIRDATEFVAAALTKKFYAVNPNMTAMYKTKYSLFAKKFDTLTTWANTSIFKPTPYSFDDGLIHVVYAGRLDLFKRPDLMFQVIAELQRLSGKARFHYMGDGDPEAFPEFAAIREITTRHGILTSPQIAERLKGLHLGVLTSDFEGMPRVVMEQLTAGRPVVALHLPQLEQVITDGESGFLVPRGEDQIPVHAARLLEAYDLMREGRMTPQGVAGHVEAFSPQSLLGKIWRDHRAIAGLPV